MSKSCLTYPPSTRFAQATEPQLRNTIGKHRACLLKLTQDDDLDNQSDLRVRSKYRRCTGRRRFLLAGRRRTVAPGNRDSSSAWIPNSAPARTPIASRKKTACRRLCRSNTSLNTHLRATGWTTKALRRQLLLFEDRKFVVLFVYSQRSGLLRPQYLPWSIDRHARRKFDGSSRNNVRTPSQPLWTSPTALSGL